MTHGQLVTAADLDGLGDSTHWFGQWTKTSFGRDAISIADIVGTWTHFVVNTSADSGSRSLRDACTQNNRLITFDPALGEATITLGSNLPVPVNCIIDMRKVRITFAGSGEVRRSSSTPGRKAFINGIFRNAGGGNMLGLHSISGAGRQHIWIGRNEFHSATADDHIDLSDFSSLGYYVTEFMNWFEPNGGTTGLVHVVGNDRSDQNNHHTRVGMIGNAFYSSASGASRIRFRMPLLTDAHLYSSLTYREWGHSPMQTRNSTSARRAMIWSQYDVWDIAKTGFEDSGAPNRGITHNGGGVPYARVDNPFRVNGDSEVTSFTVPEFDEDDVTASTFFVDESGNSLAAYNNFNAAAFIATYIGVGADGVDVREWLRQNSKWMDYVTVTGTAQGAAAGELAGKTIVLTTSVDNWPTLTDAGKNALIAGSYSTGSKWAEIKAMLSPGDIGVSNKALTITLPAGASSVTFSESEEVRFRIPGSLQARGGYTEGNVAITIATGSAGDPPEEEDLVLTVAGDYSADNEFRSSAYTSFPSTVANPTLWVGVGSDGGVYRASIRLPIAELKAISDLRITGVAIVGAVHSTTNAGAETWKWGAYRSTGQEDPEADAAQVEFDGCNVTSPFTTTTALRTAGGYTVDLGAAAIASLEAAIAADADYWSVAVQQTDEVTADSKTVLRGTAQTNGPQLRVTYQVIPTPEPPIELTAAMRRFLAVFAPGGHMERVAGL